MRTRKYSFSFISFIFLFHIILVPAAGAVNKIMPLGDSNTSGIVGSSNDTGYRRSLYFSLTEAGSSPDFVGSRSTGIPDDFDKDHEGHGGWTADEIVNGRPGDPLAGNLAIWLDDEQPQIVLLHIGTNDLTSISDDVEAILDEVDAYESANSVTTWVVLARIINRNCSTEEPPCPESDTTRLFNDNVEDMALDRINNPANPAFPDKIVIADMEYGAGIDYRLQPLGDMADDLHPFDTGYDKMADLWFSGLMEILPQADAGPDLSVGAFGTVTLDGSGSTDPKNGTLSYQWVQTAGTSVVLSDPQAVQPMFEAPAAGANGEVLNFMLTVTDEDELISTDMVEINVVPFAEITGTWSSGIWYRDVAGSQWTQMTSSTTMGDITAGDFTGDGIADVASIWPSGLWYQEGDTLAWTKVTGSAPNRITAGDVTGDGRAEIIGTWSSGIWYWDVAEYSWTQMTSSVTDADIAAGDFTGDGIADVASVWSGGLWYQDGNTLAWTKVTASAPDKITAGDVTGDGRSEIIGTWSNGIWYRNVTESSWTQMTSSVTDADIAAGDFTGDGIADIASSWGNGLWYQDGATLVWTKVSSSAADRLTAGDFINN